MTWCGWRQGIEVTLNGACDAGAHGHHTDRDKSAGFGNMKLFVWRVDYIVEPQTSSVASFLYIYNTGCL
jgi:hypothetical protein